jgi:hypothetical protein
MKPEIKGVEPFTRFLSTGILGAGLIPALARSGIFQVAQFLDASLPWLGVV